MISLIVLYEFYNLITLSNPAKHYGLLPGSPIAILAIAQTQDQVKETLFKAIKGYIEGSNFFRGLLRSKKIELQAEEIKCYEKKVSIFAKHTNSKALVGYNIKCLVLDEAARFEYDEFGRSKADGIWDNIGRACFHKNNYLLTSDGYIKVEELLHSYPNNDIKVLTYDPITYETLQTNQVTLWDNGLHETKSITTSSGRTETFTNNHPVLIWKDNSTHPEWIDTGDLSLGDYIASARELNIFNNTSLLNPEEARLIGYLQGDGGLSVNSIRFTNKDIEIIDDIQNILANNFPHCFIRKIDNFYGWVFKKSTGYRNQLITRLKELKIPRCKAPVKRVPSCISSGTKRVIANFFNGLFATDGYVTNSTAPHVGIALSSEEFIRDVQRELIRFGIYSSIRYKESKGGKNRNGAQIKDSKAWVLEIRDYVSIKTFYTEIGIVSKNNQIKEILDSCFQANKKRSNSKFNVCPLGTTLRVKSLQMTKGIKWGDLGLDYHYKNTKFNKESILKAAYVLEDYTLINLVNNFFWEEVTGIITNEPEQTIGITVDNTGIIANPIISHNTISRFGKYGKKIAISSAWEPGDYIEKLYEVAEKSINTLAFRLKTWQVNLSPNSTEFVIKNSEDYIKDPVAAAVEYEGVRALKQGSFFIPNNVKACFTGQSVVDAIQIPIDITNKENDTRTYTGIKISRLVKSTIQSFAHVDYGVKKDGAAFAVCSPLEIEPGKWGVSVDVLMLWKPYVDRDSNNKGIKRIVSFINTEEIFYEVAKARRVTKFSFDAYQSESAIQRLHLEGINTCLMSTATAEQSKYYTTTRKLMDHGLLILPRDSHWSTSAELELSNIIELPNGKITHSVYAKDLSDAITNSVYNCYLHMVQNGTIIQNAAFTSSISRVSNNTYTSSSNLRSKLSSVKQTLQRLKNLK